MDFGDNKGVEIISWEQKLILLLYEPIPRDQFGDIDNKL